ncbi:hypothetical protein [Celeribacter neptunius]|uniref:Uncharacterized protein n=1 Tax=Celeribacter neptunius TaxID=588602 RepID=A0A1I3L0W9_9RHOB|nr:hypothetical protein [Celeribacter neptunius]SFI78248.1 hypothetical protein SAMN04487991_0856 [Celeribacter neptunius]
MGTIRQAIFGELISPLDSRQLRQNHVILMVGEPQDMQGLKCHFPKTAQLFCLAFGDLTPELLRKMAPDSVIAPAMGNTFDCLDLARLLQAAEFKGAYRILAGDLPRPDIIRAELRTLYPQLSCDLLLPAPMQVDALH